MKKKIACISLIALPVFIWVFSTKCQNSRESMDPLPLQGVIRMGMSDTELLEKLPASKITVTGNSNDKVIEKLFIYDVPMNRFWNTFRIISRNSEVQLAQYNGFTKRGVGGGARRENLRLLFRQLQQLLGTTFEKRITTFYLDDGTDGRSAMYVWKRENDVVALAHSPVRYTRMVGWGYCEITIAPTIEDLKKWRGVLDEPRSEDEVLWVDAMGEN